MTDFKEEIAANLPTPEQIITYLTEGRGRLKRGALAKYFKLKGAQRRALRHLLRQMAGEGQIVLAAGNYVVLPKPLPSPLLVEVSAISPEDGALMAMPLDQSLNVQGVTIYVEGQMALRVGDQVEARLTHLERQTYVAHPIRKIEKVENTTLLGTFTSLGEGLPGQVLPLESNAPARRYLVPAQKGLKEKGLKDGAVVLIQPEKNEAAAYGTAPTAEVIEILGDELGGLESLIAIHNFGIPYEFPQEVLNGAEALPARLTKAEVAQRVDLRQLPFVTIDGADAKDFDDAIFVEQNKDGNFTAYVAIADVAHYIKEGSDLDKEAFNRGNSTYFPDRVVPMLPERLSNDLCSLRPHEDRPVLAVKMDVSKEGALQNFTFMRGVIHSHARLTYDQVMDAIGGTFDDVTKDLWPQALQPAYMCYKALLQAREARHALDLDMPETSIIVGPGGKVMKAEKKERHDAHRLIEELMILANVAAAKALERKKAACMYRVHLPPSPEKLELLKTVLQQHKIPFKKSVNLKPEHICDLIRKVIGLPEAPLLMQSILRAQQQAVYALGNQGHFGLALTHYAHFTSPIRRYSDLIVHRSLIQAFNLPGEGALNQDKKELSAVAEHISITERRSQRAEWDAKDRLIARYYQDKIGEVYEGTVTSVQKFGVFMAIEGGVAEGLLPMRLMGEDYFRFDEKKHILIGTRSGAIFKMGTKAEVTLIGADLTTGQLTFALGKVDVEDVQLEKPSKGGRRGRKASRQNDRERGGHKEKTKANTQGKKIDKKQAKKTKRPRRKIRK